jgi:hypothetical protein
MIILNTKTLKITVFLTFFAFFLSACNGKKFGADARKFPADPAKRIENNLAEGRGFKLNEAFKGQRGGVLILQVLIVFGELH